MKMTGAQAMIQALEHEGVTTVFGYPGAAICPFYDALFDSKIRHILTRNEQGAAHAASGYARAARKTGVCIATSGPGATNLITGIATAYMDSIPLVAITGQVATDLIGSDSFQEADITGATSPFTKHNYLVKSAADLPRVIKEAFYIASTGRPGPVLIDVPMDIQADCFEYQAPGPVSLPGYHIRSGVTSAQAEAFAEQLRQAKAPIICAGGGIISCEASPLLVQVVNKFQIPVVTTMMGIGALPFDHPLYLGTLGSHGVFAANYALNKADLVILIGARVGNRAMGAAAEIARRAQIIHIDIDPAEIGKNIKPHLAMVADARDALQVMLDFDNIPDFADWVTTVQDIKAKRAYTTRLDQPSATIHPPSLMRRLGELAGPDAIVTTEVGQNQIWVANHYPIVMPRTFISSGGMGTMGYGLPASLGAKVACPERTVIAVSGDGSLQMSIQEFGTVKQEKAAIKFVLLNNNRLGMVHEIQSLRYSQRYSQVFLEENPDFQLIAEAYGFAHAKISSNDQIDQAVQAMLAYPGPYLLECQIDPHEPTLFTAKKEGAQ
jgi:acetolactate synthase-1/2/3 large subunit